MAERLSTERRVRDTLEDYAESFVERATIRNVDDKGKSKNQSAVLGGEPAVP